MERLLTEKLGSTRGARLKNNGLKIRDRGILATNLLALLFILIGSTSFNAHALGVGAPDVKSYIGEHLSVRIPLFNVVDPNSLSIDFESKQFDNDSDANVSAGLDRSNSQLGILISSDSVVNEPYVSFTLSLVDNNTEFTKEFTVLMDLRNPAGTTRIPVGNSTSARSTPVFPGSSSIKAFDVVQPSQGNILGPYDTAQKGNIPERFGAVLDGQSLWRVARRINGAMGVSRSQMMWALYEANREAFSSRSINSLKAGSFLTIPDELTVKSVSDVDANAKLKSLEFDLQSDSSSGSESDNSSLAENVTDSIGVEEQGSSVAPPFQVTNIDGSDAGKNSANGVQSEQIIMSLTETVGNLSQQLVRKDQKIDFLEKQVSELKGFIGKSELNNASLPAISELPLEATPSLLAQQETPLAQQETPVAQQETPVAQQQKALSKDVVLNPQETPSLQRTVPVWQWLALCILGLSAMVYFFRERLLALAESLNLFGSSDHVELNTVMEEAPAMSPSGGYQHSKVIDKNPSAAPQVATEEIVSQMIGDEDDDLDETAFLEMDSESLMDSEEILEFYSEEMSEEVVDGEEALSFDERFELLLNEGDFKFARELLDFARYNEINDERYHCERLRLYEKMKDEDEFYEYYYEIEAKIPDFPQHLQTQISTLVVQLAHRQSAT